MFEEHACAGEAVSKGEKLHVAPLGVIRGLCCEGPPHGCGSEDIELVNEISKKVEELAAEGQRKYGSTAGVWFLLPILAILAKPGQRLVCLPD